MEELEKQQISRKLQILQKLRNLQYFAVFIAQLGTRRSLEEPEKQQISQKLQSLQKLQNHLDHR